MGVCRTGELARVSSYFAHLGEEDPLRGRRGSGTIFHALQSALSVLPERGHQPDR
jgi:uncharacterized Fe-S radical SAM superfamily protein PflX